MNGLMRSATYRLLSPWVRYRGPAHGVYLTFDDGPDPERTPLLIEQLAAHAVQATFFMIGESAERHASLARRVAAAGHAIGYHSHSHPHMRKLRPAMQRAELEGVEKLQGVLGAPVRLYRPPYGELTLTQMTWCRSAAMPLVMWSVDSDDSFTEDAATIAERTATATRDGDIILLHDDTTSAISAVPLLLRRLREQGLACRSLHQLEGD